MRVVGLWLLWCWASAVSALQLPLAPVFRQIGVDAGLPSSRINVLATDQQGYLWIATDDGLSRYDGVRFSVWRYNPGVVGGLPGNSVQALLVDASNQVWLGVEGQPPVRLDAAREHFSEIAGLPAGVVDVMAFAATPDGAVWIGTFGHGLHRVGSDGQVRSFRAGDAASGGLPSEQILDLRTDASGQLWVATMKGLLRLSGDEFVPEGESAFGAVPVFALSADGHGHLWVTLADRSLWVRGGQHGSVFEQSPWSSQLEGALVRHVYSAREDQHWLSTTQGLLLASGDEIKRFPGTPAAEANLMMALPDSDGGLWFADAENALLRLPPLWAEFAALQQRPGSPWSPGSRDIVAVAEARDGGLWMAGSQRALRHLSADGAHLRAIPDVPIAVGQRLFSVAETFDGSLWVGGATGLGRRDAAGRWRVFERGAVGGVPPGSIDLLAVDGDGNLWLSAYGGGMQQRAPDGSVLLDLPPGSAGLPDETPEALVVAPDGGVWVAGDSGLFRWNGARFDAWLGSEGGAIQGLAFGAENDLWVYRPGLLSRYRLYDDRLEPLDQASSGNEGMPAADAGGVMVDAQGRVWLTTVRGLFRFDPASRNLRRFGVGDGLPSIEFSLRPPLLHRSGLMAAGTVDGLVLFNPLNLSASAALPPLRIEAVRVRRGEDDLKFPGGDVVELRAGDRDLRVEARLLSYTDPSAHRYRFRLRNYDPDWVDVGGDGQREWSQLAPGEYELDVIGNRGSSEWTAAQTLVIRVLPPWTQTLPAYIAYAFLLASLLVAVWWLARRRYGRAKERELAEQQRVLAVQASEAKSRFLATLGHEIRTPLTGVLGMAELLLKSPLADDQRQRVRTVQRAGEHLLRLVNDALDLARIEAGKLSLLDEAFDVHTLLVECHTLLLPVAEGKHLALQLDIEPTLPRVLRGDAGRVRQIVLNLVGNAVKFTERGTVLIRAAPMPVGGVCIEIQDSGLGLSDEQQARLFKRFEQADGERTALRYGGSGLGLAISQELAQAMGGRITLRSTLGEGSCFSLALPLPTAERRAGTRVMPAADDTVIPRQVLLVEDDPVVAQVVVGLLASNGHVVCHALNALEALSTVHQQAFDLALLDLDLPGVDGFELAGLLRQIAPDLALVALTARADTEAEQRSREVGMQGFLRKPVSGEQLAAAVATYARY